jgi:ubiquinone/menaquinone biosynthesis C-methylase UbiE
MSTTLNFDAKAAAHIDEIYATPDVAATRIATYRAANPKLGERVLDLGCGPGYLLRDLAASVGPTGDATGVDLSDAMLTIARARCAPWPFVKLLNADVTKLPLADRSIDLACVSQVYAYVTRLDDALAELRRVLVSNGRAVILDTDFSGVVWESADRSRMRSVLAAYDKHVAWPDLPRILPRKLRDAGLILQRCEAIPFVTTRYHRNTYVHGIARFIRRFVTEQGGVPEEVAAAWLAEFDELERSGSFFFAMNRFLFVASAPA